MVRLRLSVIALGGMLALGLAGCGSTGNGSGGNSGGSSQGQQPAQAQPTPTPTPSIALEECQTNYGAGSPSSVTPNISSSQYQDNGFPVGDVGSLDLFVSAGPQQNASQVGMAVIAPSSWGGCLGTYGADGTGSLVVPPGTGSDNSEGVELSIGNGGGPSYYAACPFFASAAAGSPVSCNASSGEDAQEVSSTEVTYTDDAGIQGNGLLSGGPNPDFGMMIWVPGSSPWQVQADCEMPSIDFATCTTILNYVAYWFGQPPG
jgi:hypothetical protein